MIHARIMSNKSSFLETIIICDSSFSGSWDIEVMLAQGNWSGIGDTRFAAD